MEHGLGEKADLASKRGSISDSSSLSSAYHVESRPVPRVAASVAGVWAGSRLSLGIPGGEGACLGNFCELNHPLTHPCVTTRGAGAESTKSFFVTVRRGVASAASVAKRAPAPPKQKRVPPPKSGGPAPRNHRVSHRFVDVGSTVHVFGCSREGSAVGVVGIWGRRQATKRKHTTGDAFVQSALACADTPGAKAAKTSAEPRESGKSGFGCHFASHSCHSPEADLHLIILGLCMVASGYPQAPPYPLV